MYPKYGRKVSLPFFFFLVCLFIFIITPELVAIVCMWLNLGHVFPNIFYVATVNIFEKSYVSKVSTPRQLIFFKKHTKNLLGKKRELICV